MRDSDIRPALRKSLAASHLGEPDTRILNELGLCQGDARIDVAVVNGAINGYEIKSEKDTLERLPGQQAVYAKTLDTVTIVVSGRHLAKVIESIPTWWGVQEAVWCDDTVAFVPHREAQPNQGVDPFHLVQLLWRDETLAMLEELDLAKGLRSKPRCVLWEKLAQALPIQALGERVRQRLKSRPAWRSDE